MTRYLSTTRDNFICEKSSFWSITNSSCFQSIFNSLFSPVPMLVAFKVQCLTLSQNKNLRQHWPIYQPLLFIHFVIHLIRWTRSKIDEKNLKRADFPSRLSPERRLNVCENGATEKGKKSCALSETDACIALLIIFVPASTTRWKWVSVSIT